MFWSKPTHSIEFFGGPYDGRVFALELGLVKPIFAVLFDHSGQVSKQQYRLVTDIVEGGRHPLQVYVHDRSLPSYLSLWRSLGGIPRDQRT